MTSKQFVIGHSRPLFFIAEIGVNHNGDVELAHKLIDVAAQAGADAAKFQTFVAERLVSPKAAKADYQKETTGGGNQFEMLKALEFPTSVWAELKTHCDEAGIIFMSSPFDEGSVDLLVETGVDALKLGSGELTNRPLIEHCALTGLPTILSTGMADRNEVEAAITWFRTAFRHGEIKKPESCMSFDEGGQLALLHCVSSYPAAPESLNLRAIHRMREFTQLPIGFSDHSSGVDIVPLAVAAGACIIEKHITLDRTLEGPDHRASIEPDELQQLIATLREVEATLGDGRKQPHASEMNVRDVARKSIVATRDIAKGETLSADDVAIRRPGTGLAPARLDQVIGREALVSIEAGTPIEPEWVDLLAPAKPSFF